MKNKFLITLIILSSCGTKTNQEIDSSVSIDDRIVLTNEQTSMLNIQTDTLRKGYSNAVIRFSAIMENSPLGRAVVSPKIGGYIKAILAAEGVIVKKGQVLAELENMELIKMQEEFLNVSAEFDFLNLELSRQRELNRNKSISDKTLQETEMRLIQANAKRNALITQFRLLGIASDRITASTISGNFNLLSPIDGIITVVKGEVGAYLNATDVVMEISDKKDLLLVGKIYERDRDKVSIGGVVKYHLNTKSDELYEAQVISISGKINDDKSLSIYCRPKDLPIEFTAGMVVNAEFMLPTQPIIAVTENAVVSFDDKNYIFTTNQNNEFIMTEIEIFGKIKGEVQIADTTLMNSIFVKSGAHSLLMAIKNLNDN